MAAPVIALLVIALVSLLAVRVGATALMMTGISWDTASFQAYSAFFGVGFTTKEAELVVNHPVRRRIIRDLGQRYGVQAWRSPKVLSTLSPHFTWTDLLAKWSGEDPMLAPHFLLSLHQWGDRLLDDQRLQAVLSKPGTVTELVVHPGYAPDPDLPLPDQLLPEHRQAEVDFITGPAFRHWLEELGVVLIGFGDLVYVHG